MSLLWDFAKSGLLYGVIAVVAYLGFNRFIELEKQNELLTNRLAQVTQLLEGEVERSKRVEESTERLEQADAERQEQLRGFERNLSVIARNSAEAKALLSTVIPDSLLDGLRSFQNTSRKLPGQSSAAAPSRKP